MRCDVALHGVAPHGVALHGIASHGIVPHGVAPHGVAPQLGNTATPQCRNAAAHVLHMCRIIWQHTSILFIILPIWRRLILIPLVSFFVLVSQYLILKPFVEREGYDVFCVRVIQYVASYDVLQDFAGNTG
jgi:hypothetical protein